MQRIAQPNAIAFDYAPDHDREVEAAMEKASGSCPSGPTFCPNTAIRELENMGFIVWSVDAGEPDSLVPWSFGAKYLVRTK